MCLSTVGHLRGIWPGAHPRIFAVKNFFLQTIGMIEVVAFLVKFICRRNLFAATKINNHLRLKTPSLIKILSFTDILAFDEKDLDMDKLLTILAT